VIYPEQRNVQGTLFGGWVAAQGFELASFVAKFFAQVAT
jgi:acyl-CoA hydrolase